MKHFFTLLAFGLLMLTPSVTWAQSDSGRLDLVTSPLPINVTTTPGQTITSEIKIRNAGEKAETLQVGVLKFEAYGDSGLPRLLDREAGDDYFDWIHFSPAKFSLEPNEWQTVAVRIDVPTTAALGYYYAVTFSRASEGTAAAPGQNALVGSTATLILLDVDVPGARREVVVSQFEPSKAWFEFLPATFTVTLENKGNIHVSPRGNIFIRNSRGQQVGTLEVNPGKGNILPQSSRSFSAKWVDGFPVYTERQENGSVVVDQKGVAEQQLQWDFSQITHLRAGNYTAELALAYTDNNKDVPVGDETSFWVLPWRIGLALLILLAVFGFGLWSMGRSAWRKIRGTDLE